MEEMAIFNRMEWMKTQPTLPGKTEKVLVETETWEEEEPITELVTWEEEVPVHEWVVVGTREEPVYEWVVVGSREKPVYKWVVVGSREETRLLVGRDRRPAGGIRRSDSRTPPDRKHERSTSRKSSRRGTRTVDVKERQQTGTRTVDVKEKQQTGTRTVTRSEHQPTGETRTVQRSRDIYDWVTPQIPNPLYQGVNFVPRYYAFSDGSPVIAFNKDGYFDGKRLVERGASRLLGRGQVDRCGPVRHHRSVAVQRGRNTQGRRLQRRTVGRLAQ